MYGTEYSADKFSLHDDACVGVAISICNEADLLATSQVGD